MVVGPRSSSPFGSPLPSEASPGSGARALGPLAGSGRVVARAHAGRTVLASARASAPLRFVEPTFPNTTSAAVCLVTFGGGLVDGDAIEVELAVEAGATLVVFTQASTKVFRGASAQDVRARVAGTLVLLPDPVAAFSGARYRQRVDVELEGDGSCVMLDGYTAGRPAHGDRWAMDGLDLRTVIRRNGRRIVSDALSLDSRDGSIAPRTGRFDAFMTLIAVGARAAPVVRAIADGPLAPPRRELVAASSRLPAAEDDGAILRVAAASPEVALAAVRERLVGLRAIGAVDPFGARP